MKRFGLILGCAALLSLVGCRAPHQRIEHGMSAAEVLALMGRPECADSWRLEDGRMAEVSIYVVAQQRRGSALTTSTSFPVVMVDGRVIGWGDAVRYLGDDEVPGSAH